MKHINTPLLIGIYSLAFFFMVRFARFYLHHLRGYAIPVDWGNRIEYLALVEIILIIIATGALVVGWLKMKISENVIVFLEILTVAGAWIIYFLPYVTTYGLSRWYITDYYYYEHGLGILLLLGGIYLTFKKIAASSQRIPN